MVNMTHSRTSHVEDENASISQKKYPRWLKYCGVAGFCFFLIKGLLWLIVPALLFYFGFGS